MAAIIFDFNRTIYDPEVGALVPGAREVLQALAGTYTLHLLSRNEPGRENILHALDIETYFMTKTFVDAKSIQVFMRVMEAAGENPAMTFIVGDYRHEDIRFGNQAGGRTILLSRGKFSRQAVQVPDDNPWVTIHELPELLNILI